MKMLNNSDEILEKVFSKFASSEEEYGFQKTIVPVELAQYGDNQLISRSQAKRLLARFDRFKTVILDFKGVETVGQGFADQIFRVFVANNPNIQLNYINASEQIAKMIQRVSAPIM